jgi:hypothetical protein
MTSDRAAGAATAPPPHYWGPEQCLKCHTDTATLAAMESKDGDKSYCQAAKDYIKSTGSDKASLFATPKPQ